MDTEETHSNRQVHSTAARPRVGLFILDSRDPSAPQVKLIDRFSSVSTVSSVVQGFPQRRSASGHAL